MDSDKENLKGETATIDRRQKKRHPFSATTEVKDLASGARSSTRAADLSQKGCYLDSLNPLPTGSKIQVRMIWAGEEVTCCGIVRVSQPGLGMGVVFTEMDEAGKALIEKWIQKLDTSGPEKLPPVSHAKAHNSVSPPPHDALALKLIDLMQKKGQLTSDDVAWLFRDEIV